MKLSRNFLILVLFLLACFVAMGQDASTVKFTLDFPHSEPEHYEILVGSDGHAVYDSNGKLTPQSTEGDPFHLEFTLTLASRDHVFDLAKRSNYFQGDLDSKLPNIAFTGKKTLAYKDTERNTQATYNYSPDPTVQELTAFFQHLAITLELGRELQFYHHYQKLALDDVLKRMEEMIQSGQLAELASIAPILQRIYKDSSVLRMTRVRTMRLLEMINNPSTFVKR